MPRKEKEMKKTVNENLWLEVFFEYNWCYVCLKQVVTVYVPGLKFLHVSKFANSTFELTQGYQCSRISTEDILNQQKKEFSRSDNICSNPNIYQGLFSTL